MYIHVNKQAHQQTDCLTHFLEKFWIMSVYNSTKYITKILSFETF